MSNVSTTCMDRKPLVWAIIILVMLMVITYLSSTSPEVGLMGSIGTMIVGIFKLIYWAAVLLVGIAVCIACLIGIFFGATYVANKEMLPGVYAGTMASLRTVLGPLYCRVVSFFKKEKTCAASVAQVVCINEAEPDTAKACCTESAQPEQAATQLLEEIKQLGASQEKLHGEFVALQQKIADLEKKNTSLSTATDQIEGIAGEMAASGKTLEQVREHVSNLQGKVDEASKKMQEINADKLLGDIPARLSGLEKNIPAVATLQKDLAELKKAIVTQQNEKKFDPEPLNDAIAVLQKDIIVLQQNLATQQQAAEKMNFDPQELNTAIALLQQEIEDIKKKAPIVKTSTVVKSTSSSKSGKKRS